jgi:hypothetical protein
MRARAAPGHGIDVDPTEALVLIEDGTLRRYPEASSPRQ